MSKKVVSFESGNLVFTMDIPSDIRYCGVADILLKNIAMNHMKDSKYLGKFFTSKKNRVGYSTLATKLRNSGDKVGYTSSEIVEALKDEKFCNDLSFEMGMMKDKKTDKMIIDIRIEDVTLSHAMNLFKNTKK